MEIRTLNTVTVEDGDMEAQVPMDGTEAVGTEAVSTEAASTDMEDPEGTAAITNG